MNLLFSIIYAGHARGTHHKLALDALRHLKCMDCDAWQRLFLKHGKLYLEGAKAPDDNFKDFKNHVLHTRDGYWGGAPEKARSWYNHLVEALAQQEWQTAVYCAGVLSHYYTDPLQPFHTAQSEAENNIHRAAEWSISRAYDDLRVMGRRDFPRMVIDVPPGPNWLVQLVCEGAEMANGHYEKLIAHYDISRGVIDPPAGLDRVAQRIVAELLRYAELSFAAVLDRAIDEANAHAPEVSLLAETLAAAAQVPFKVIAKRIGDAEERRLVERMYDELIKTGTVEAHLPEDDRTVRDLHAAEVVAQRQPQPDASKVFPFRPRERVVTNIDRQRASRAGGSAAPIDNVVPLRASSQLPERPAAAAPTPAARAVASTEVARDPPKEIAAPAPRRTGSALTERLALVVVAANTARDDKPAAAPATASENADRRFYLSLDQNVVDAPAIGPKTAERLAPHGILTVRDLLKAEPVALAVLADMRHITPEAILDWQDQARLVCTVPGLRGTHAQLLVGSGYRSGDAIAAVDADKLCADVLAFAASPNGQRLLRNGDPPDIEKIKGWLEAARSTKAA